MPRVLAIDPGSKRVGLAVSDESAVIAQPLEQVAAEPADSLVARLAAVAARVGATELVVGLPKRMDGSGGPEAAAARRLGDALRVATRLPVTMVDERLSSVSAERSLLETGMRRRRRREVRDQVAAAIILQTYLDRRSRGRRG